jgi:BirA family transcriptional regulator, biotin operon repressor / biotin---[acetyl-CoA-carboxylase] ligase
MVTERALRRALERAGLDAPVRFDEVTGSTQETARRRAEEGAPEWTLVAAGHQTAGRGRLGRSWNDVPGQALMFSLVLRPELHPERAGLLTLLVGWAMATAARDRGRGVGCKWPNDLMLGDAKVGGILAESVVEGDRLAYVSIGVGVNVGAAPADVAGAGSLDEPDPAALLEGFLGHLAHRYEPGHPAFAGAVLEGYRDVCVTLGRTVRVLTAGGGLGPEGEAVDVDDTGALVLRTGRGLVPVRSGEVEHLAV